MKKECFKNVGCIFGDPATLLPAQVALTCMLGVPYSLPHQSLLAHPAHPLPVVAGHALLALLTLNQGSNLLL